MNDEMIFRCWLTSFSKISVRTMALPKRTLMKMRSRLLQEYDWTGNIRELRNVVERLVILSGKTITGEDVESYVMPR